MKFLLACVLFLFSSTLLAANLTEHEAVTQGLRHPAIASQLEARLGLAQGRVESAGRWDNPDIEYERESLDFAGGSVEGRSFLIRQRLDLAGVKRRERLSASLEFEAEEARMELNKRELVATVRDAFYSAMAAKRYQQEVERWHARFKELVLSVRSRAQSGDVSRYDESRVSRELALLEGKRLIAKSDAESGRDQLAMLTGLDNFELAGQLLPPHVQPDNTLAVLAHHPMLNALNAEADSAVHLQEAASRERWPQVSLGLGYKEIREPGMRADGTIISLGIELPLFERGQGRERVAYERSRLVSAERDLEQQRLQAEARAVMRRLQASIGAVNALSSEQSRGLIEMAEAAYQAGELSVMELMDAWRAELSTQLALIDSSLAARRAYIEWQTVTGE